MQTSIDFNDKALSDLEFSRKLMAEFREQMKDFDPSDYEFDRAQLGNLIDLIEFFENAANDLGGKIESIDLDPADPPNGITANFIVFDLFGDDVKRFCDVIRNCSAISMDVTTDNEISISCTIPNVYVRKIK